MAWSDESRFPSLRQLPDLRTVCLVLRRMPEQHPLRWSAMPSPPSVHNITTLAVYNKTEDGPATSTTVDNLLGLQFPHLRVLTLDSVNEDVYTIFMFIHRHPTILEVNVISSEENELRLEALFALIDGTGTWSRDGLDSQYAHVRIHELTNEDYDIDDPIPPDIARVSLYIYEFAFVRTPTSPAATQWCLPIGSSERRYRCTALSFKVLQEDPDNGDEISFRNDTLRPLKDFGIAASLTELRVFADASMAYNLRKKFIPSLLRNPSF